MLGTHMERIVSFHIISEHELSRLTSYRNIYIYYGNICSVLRSCTNDPHVDAHRIRLRGVMDVWIVEVRRQSNVSEEVYTMEV